MHVFLFGVKDAKDKLNPMIFAPYPTYSEMLFKIPNQTMLFWGSRIPFFTAGLPDFNWHYFGLFRVPCLLPTQHPFSSLYPAPYLDTVLVLNVFHDSDLLVESLPIRSMRSVWKTANNEGQSESVMIAWLLSFNFQKLPP